jgi:ATP-dependent RNA helicase DDX5/DBP2
MGSSSTDKKDRKADKKDRKDSKRKHKRELESLHDAEHEQESKRLRAYSKGSDDDDDSNAKEHHHGDSKHKRRRTRSMDVKESESADGKQAGSDDEVLSPTEWRKHHSITIQGHTKSAIPDPYFQFTDTPFSEKILEGFKRAGFAKPTPIQSQSWPIALQNQDMICVAKTGSGKVSHAEKEFDGVTIQ